VIGVAPKPPVPLGTDEVVVVVVLVDAGVVGAGVLGGNGGIG
jgi:hypothetical protein